MVLFDRVPSIATNSTSSVTTVSSTRGLSKNSCDSNGTDFKDRSKALLNGQSIKLRRRASAASVDAGNNNIAERHSKGHKYGVGINGSKDHGGKVTGSIIRRKSLPEIVSAVSLKCKSKNVDGRRMRKHTDGSHLDQQRDDSCHGTIKSSSKSVDVRTDGSCDKKRFSSREGKISPKIDITSRRKRSASLCLARNKSESEVENSSALESSVHGLSDRSFSTTTELPASKPADRSPSELASNLTIKPLFDLVGKLKLPSLKTQTDTSEVECKLVPFDESSQLEKRQSDKYSNGERSSVEKEGSLSRVCRSDTDRFHGMDMEQLNDSFKAEAIICKNVSSRNEWKGRKKGIENRNELSCSDTDLLSMEAQAPKGSRNHNRKERERKPKNEELFRRSTSELNLSRSTRSSFVDRSMTNRPRNVSDQISNSFLCSDTDLFVDMKLRQPGNSMNTSGFRRSFPNQTESVARRSSERDHSMLRRSSTDFKSSEATSSNLGSMNGSLKPRSKNNSEEHREQNQWTNSNTSTDGVYPFYLVSEGESANDQIQSVPSVTNLSNTPTGILRKPSIGWDPPQIAGSPYKPTSRKARRDRATRVHDVNRRRSVTGTSPERSIPISDHAGRRNTWCQSPGMTTERRASLDLSLRSKENRTLKSSSRSSAGEAAEIFSRDVNEPPTSREEGEVGSHCDEQHQRDFELPQHGTELKNANNSYMAIQNRIRLSPEPPCSTELVEIQTNSSLEDDTKLSLDPSYRDMESDISLRELAELFKGKSDHSKDLLEEVHSVRSALQQRNKGQHQLLLPDLIDDCGSADDSFSPNIPRVKSLGTIGARTVPGMLPPVSKKFSGRSSVTQSPHQEQKYAVDVLTTTEQVPSSPLSRQPSALSSGPFTDQGFQVERSKGSKQAKTLPSGPPRGTSSIICSSVGSKSVQIDAPFPNFHQNQRNHIHLGSSRTRKSFEQSKKVSGTMKSNTNTMSRTSMLADQKSNQRINTIVEKITEINASNRKNPVSESKHKNGITTNGKPKLTGITLELAGEEYMLVKLTNRTDHARPNLIAEMY